MRTPAFILLTTSLAFNAALAFLLVRGATNPAPETEQRVTATAPAPAKNEAALIDETVWPAMQTDDLPALVSRLRGAGFPPDMVRAILSAQISDSIAARLKALDPGADKRGFWKNSVPNPQLQAARNKLYREQEKMLENLLGDDADSNDPLSVAQLQRQLGGVPPDKVADVRQIMREFADKRADLSIGGIMLATDMEKIRNLQSEQEAAIARILTPAEYAEYELRSSSTASSLRYQLTTFDPTEQEFRTIFQLQRAFDLQYQNLSYGISGTPTPEQMQQMRQRDEAQKALGEQIKAALGPVRAEDYTRSIDYQYQQTSRLVARLELAAETTNQIYAAQKDFQQRISSIQQDRAMPMDQRIQQLTALQQEATAKIAPLLGGTRGLEAYKQYGGNWLQNMVPRPPPTAAAVPLPRL